MYNMGRATLKIAKNELQLVFRERVVIVLGILIAMLIGMSFYTGYISYEEQESAIANEQRKKRQEWLSQGDKHPHIAAHYGTFIFKPKSLLSLFDLGLDSYTGTSVYLEAHYQHELMFRPAQDRGSMIRFGELSPAFVMQLLVPLLIIFLGFRSFTKERETGTLKLLMAQGVSISSIIWGKILAYCTVIFILLLLPVCVITIFWVGFFDLPNVLAPSYWRIFLLLFAYAAYLFVFIAFTVYISLRSSTGRNALLTLLIFWVLLVVIVPKTAATLGKIIYPLPSMRVFKENIQRDINLGINGMTPPSVRRENLKQEYLDTYNVDSLNQLPFNYEGVSMQAGEEYNNKVYDLHWTRLRSIFEQQSNFVAKISLANPFLAVESLSMGLSETDMHTAFHFEDQVEDYRRNLIEKMNNDMAQNSKYGEFYEYKASESLWKEIKEFNYSIPTVSNIVNVYKTAFLSLFVWLFFTLTMLYRASSKNRLKYE